jgi:hypothetical protein
MRTDKYGIVWPDDYPDKKTIKRVLNRIIRKKLTIEEMTEREREVFLFVQTQHMQRYLQMKKRARSYLAAGMSKQQIADKIANIMRVEPGYVAQIEQEPEVRRCRDAGLTTEQTASQLDMPEERVKRIIKEIENEEFAEQQVKERLGKAAAEHMWNAVWGPRSELILTHDNGKRTPAPTDPTVEAVFHFQNLERDAGDAAEAVRYLRRHTEGSDPEATADSIRELVHKTGVPLHVH